MSNGMVSPQLIELGTEFTDSLGRLNLLIENRGAWEDGIEGCREAATLLAQSRERLQAITDVAKKLEADMASARAELERWSKMHADLSAVERDLRAECDCLRKAHADLSLAESELRVACDRKHAALAKQAASLANTRLLAEEIIREVGS